MSEELRGLKQVQVTQPSKSEVVVALSDDTSRKRKADALDLNTKSDAEWGTESDGMRCFPLSEAYVDCPTPPRRVPSAERYVADGL
jgi:hypothetical protein